MTEKEREDEIMYQLARATTEIFNSLGGNFKAELPPHRKPKPPSDVSPSS